MDLKNGFLKSTIFFLSQVCLKEREGEEKQMYPHSSMCEFHAFFG